MKKILPLLGVLFLAQVSFVGMIHVFLLIQGKDSPETLATLSRLPVIGGFFPHPGEIPAEPTPADKQDDDMRRMLAEGDELYRLPREIDVKELESTIASTRKARARYEELTEELKTEQEALQVRKSQLLADQEQLTQKIDKLAALEARLDAQWKELGAKQRIITEEEVRIYGRLGEIYAKMQPDKASQVLMAMEPPQAARILEAIEPRNQGKIFDAMETTAQVAIQKHMLKPAFRGSSEKTDTGAGGPGSPAAVEDRR